MAHRGPAERGIEVVSVLFIDRFWLSRTLPIWEVDDALQLGSRLSLREHRLMLVVARADLRRGGRRPQPRPYLVRSGRVDQ